MANLLDQLEQLGQVLGWASVDDEQLGRWHDSEV
jgi:hypothetical protein